MSQITSFTPGANTIAVTPSATSAQIALPTAVGSGIEQIRVSNRTTQDVYITWGTSSSITAVVPTPGNPSAAIHIPPNDVEVISPIAGTTNIAYIQAVAGTGNLYIVQGEGL